MKRIGFLAVLLAVVFAFATTTWAQIPEGATISVQPTLKGVGGEKMTKGLIVPPELNYCWFPEGSYYSFRVLAQNIKKSYRLKFWVNGQYEGQTTVQNDQPVKAAENSTKWVRMIPKTETDTTLRLKRPGKYNIETQVFINKNDYFSYEFEVELTKLDFWANPCITGDSVRVRWVIRPQFNLQLVEESKVNLTVGENYFENLLLRKANNFGEYYVEVIVPKIVYENVFAGYRDTNICVTRINGSLFCQQKLGYYYTSNYEWMYECP